MEVEIINSEETGSVKYYAYDVEIDGYPVSVTITEMRDYNSGSETYELTVVENPEDLPINEEDLLSAILNKGEKE